MCFIHRPNLPHSSDLFIPYLSLHQALQGALGEKGWFSGNYPAAGDKPHLAGHREQGEELIEEHCEGQAKGHGHPAHEEGGSI